ncbi:thioredoxin family protein [Microbulbifer rhizosphaerae]|uniref:Thiol-disulfide isomerase/thioredoxin n=1 Tax=Microbulbifer rhizosphaerae TaxID=1562603 RepID=A0A7W4WBN9_9GAMM|nr:thioredoxin family protein [Microbulbifer rhizosphaerae]MBB3061320.1 thiol-disulfide isomerase/thioredoxin [Microbulbifer rhizosphaerae]
MMHKTLSALTGYVVLLYSLILAPVAMAQGTESFSMKRFEMLQEQGENVLVHISAPWCSSCRKQKQILTEYQQQYPDAGLHILNVDYDTQKQWVTHFKAPHQSTLVLFSGTEQVWLSVGETRKERIFSQLEAVTDEP